MPAVFPQPDFPDYELLDSGAGEKLERFGPVVLCRPDPQALWSKRRPTADWDRADLTFVRESDRGGRWERRDGAHPETAGDDAAWHVRSGDATFVVRPTPFKHVGLFPEQAANWELLRSTSVQFDAARPRLLDLFGYTGAAGVVAAQSGWDVTLVDASKTSIAWARENALASGLGADAFRVLVDDALGFARREVRRGSRYAAVLLDPPHYGRGPKGETWRFEERIAELVGAVRELLDERAFCVLSTYAIGTSPLALEHLAREFGAGDVQAGELALPAAAGERALPAGFCVRWSRGVDLA